MNTQEFEKQTLEQLLIDLKDINNYKSFRKGAFVYDLGYYKGRLLIDELERYKNIIDELEKDWKKQQEHYRYYKDNRYRTFLSKNLEKLKELKGE